MKNQMGNAFINIQQLWDKMWENPDIFKIYDDVYNLGNQIESQVWDQVHGQIFVQLWNIDMGQLDV